MNTSLRNAKAAKSQCAKVFADLVGDVAVGIVNLGDNRFGLKVNLTDEPTTDVTLPTEIDGVPVKVEIVGRIRKR
jgi:hypothetical protein